MRSDRGVRRDEHGRWDTQGSNGDGGTTSRKCATSSIILRRKASLGGPFEMLYLAVILTKFGWPLDKAQ